MQEALANVSRHSQAGRAEIELVYAKTSITCTISDDGVGFDTDKERAGFGLRSMGERAAALGGGLKYESAPGEGTAIVLFIPLDEPPISGMEEPYG